MLVEEYISEGGAHIKVYDDFIDDSPENRERIYNNLSRIVTGIMLRQYDEKRQKEVIDSKRECDRNEIQN